MAIISWKECYATGIERFDQEHQELVASVNRLYEAIRGKTTQDELPAIIEELTNYTLSHFAHEEELMAEYQYPNFEAHLQEHLALRDRIAEFQKGAEDPHQMALQLFTFLREWLLHHIVEVDGLYGPFLREKGLS